MLDGEEGEGVRMALEALVKTGEFMGAKNMVEIGLAHASAECCEHHGLDYLMKLAELEAKFRVPTSFMMGYMDRVRWKELGVLPDLAKYHFKFIKTIEDMGALTPLGPDDSGSHVLPCHFGQHISAGGSGGSSQNAIVGARCNGDSHLFAALAGITGRTPNYGFHLKENRYGNVLVKVEAQLKNPYDWPAVNQVLSEKIGGDVTTVPVFTGLPPHPGMPSVCNTPFHMYHIPGKTPEAPTIEAAFGPNKARETMTITNRDIKEIFDMYEPVGAEKEVQIVANMGPFGNNIRYIARWAKALNGKKVAEGVHLWLYCSRSLSALAEIMGMKAIIEEAGGLLVNDTYLIMMDGVTTPPSAARKRGLRTCVTNTLPIYMPGCTGIKTYFRPFDLMVDAALTGRIKEWSHE